MKLYLRQKYRENIKFELKLRVFMLVIGIGFAIFVLRLAHLQLLGGTKFRHLSDRNRIRLVRLKAPRGLVYDRNGVLLVDNRPSFTVSIIRAETHDPAATLATLRRFVEFDEEQVLATLNTSKESPFTQIVVARDISIEQAAAIEEYSLRLPGITISAEPCRRFPRGEYAAHVLGYLGEINARELNRLADEGYRQGDYIGKAGIELVAESWLRGEDGGVRVQVYADGRPQMELDQVGNPSVRIDTVGRPLKTLHKKSPSPGKALRLTLDAEMQAIAEQEMNEYAGAIVIMDPASGAIRAMVSKPSFDPNAFVSFGAAEERLDLLNDPMHPLLNRALQAYPPGSTFKIITAYAGLAENAIDRETRYTCTGAFYLGRRFRCWKDHGHGSVNIIQALAYSCDVFFYNVGLEVGIEHLAAHARAFGFGRPTGIELPGEMAGVVPSPKWKAETFKNLSDKRWYDGETVNASIGQGYTLVTPLQLARMFAAVVNGGKLVRPHVIETLEKNVRAPHAEDMTPGDWDETALEIIKDGLRQAVNSRKPFYGTAWRAKSDVVELIGKTGTAQLVGFKERADTEEKLKQIPYEHRDHSWFVAATEGTAEPLVLIVFVEHGGHASESAVPVGKAIAERISELQRQTQEETQERPHA
ncbi:MAG: penicillin-binding protein 2 [Candidatus Abyssubacteria bacterium]